jgi:DnaD family protein
MELSEENKKIIASSELALYISLTADKIDSEIDKMINKKLVTVTSKSINFMNLFMKISDLITAEYSDFNNNSFIKSINSNLASKVSLEEIAYLNDNLKSLSKEKIIEISQDENVKSFNELVTSIDKERKKKIQQISKYN